MLCGCMYGHTAFTSVRGQVPDSFIFLSYNSKDIVQIHQVSSMNNSLRLLE